MGLYHNKQHITTPISGVVILRQHRHQVNGAKIKIAFVRTHSGHFSTFFEYIELTHHIHVMMHHIVAMKVQRMIIVELIIRIYIYISIFLCFFHEQKS
jgi:hypothetical protein